MKNLQNWFNGALSFILVLLGFTACDNNGSGSGMCEYGTPLTKFQVKGTVSNSAKSPLEGIRVITSDSNPYTPEDTVYTNAKGEFISGEMSVVTIGEQCKTFYEDPGGRFEKDSTALTTVPSKQIEKGDGWYVGKFELTADKALKAKTDGK